MRGNKAVVGIYTYLDDALNTVRRAQAAELDYRVYSPTIIHEIEDVAMPGKSPVRFFTFTGGLIGCISGFALAVWCSLDWPLRVSAKDIVSPPGFVVIGYECTILFGALSTLLALLHFCRLPDVLRKVGYDPRFSEDKFGVVVGCQSSQVDDVKRAMEECGADEVNVKDSL